LCLQEGSKDFQHGDQKKGSERESVKGAILRDFLQAAKCDEFDIQHRNPLGLQLRRSGKLTHPCSPKVTQAF
ncbi:MAG TPA: hypothetical protein VII81_01650, partial [Terriglobales bacterium]